ncbi:hypothetical protein DACRYDRAFT_23400 [Dacryopinax primogenitus]|uniref:Uncharacterized protein n=1 Tax=Dacryopinax primogenitus (strain DJM 731) TaxID=1858805 RepID=M5FRM2_DACPD|nr:uncharacterized protein DACRYDRAFT_23400 [Dacryopinax primogenitus]EJT99820.1 hypothetical protein DACRYDRAFT_23400 [Dacryopinax primogenitus]
MQKAQEEASEQSTIHAVADKEWWDHQLNIRMEGTQQGFEVGQKVLLQNETANKGDAHCHFANPNTRSAPIMVTEDKTRCAPVTVAEDKAQSAPVMVAEDESQNTQ